MANDSGREDETRKKQAVQEWCRSQQLYGNNESMEYATQVGWIDLYRDGRFSTPPRASFGARATIKADLGDFNG